MKKNLEPIRNVFYHTSNVSQIIIRSSIFDEDFILFSIEKLEYEIDFNSDVKYEIGSDLEPVVLFPKETHGEGKIVGFVVSDKKSQMSLRNLITAKPNGLININVFDIIIKDKLDTDYTETIVLKDCIIKSLKTIMETGNFVKEEIKFEFSKIIGL